MFFEEREREREQQILHTCKHVCRHAHKQYTLLKILEHCYLFIFKIKCDEGNGNKKGINGNRKIGFPCRSVNDVEFCFKHTFRAHLSRLCWKHKNKYTFGVQSHTFSTNFFGISSPMHFTLLVAFYTSLSLCVPAAYWFWFRFLFTLLIWCIF